MVSKRAFMQSLMAACTFIVFVSAKSAQGQYSTPVGLCSQIGVSPAFSPAATSVSVYFQTDAGASGGPVSYPLNGYQQYEITDVLGAESTIGGIQYNISPGYYRIDYYSGSTLVQEGNHFHFDGKTPTCPEAQTPLGISGQYVVSSSNPKIIPGTSLFLRSLDHAGGPGIIVFTDPNGQFVAYIQYINGQAAFIPPGNYYLSDNNCNQIGPDIPYFPDSTKGNVNGSTSSTYYASSVELSRVSLSGRGGSCPD